MTSASALIIEVEMHAFANGAIRKVEIPVDRLPQFGVQASRNEILGLAFEYGQNDFQPQPMPSVSVGDIIRLPQGHRFVVLGVGFIEVPADFAPPEGDRGGMYAYGLRNAAPPEPRIATVSSAQIAGLCRNGHALCLLARCRV